MNQLWNYILDALNLLIRYDNEVFTLIKTSFQISISSTLIASLIAFPFGIWFGLSEFRGRNILDMLFNTMLFVPTVVIGHLVYLFLTKNGPLGHLELLYTKTAIIIGQVFLAFPIIFTMVANSIRAADKRIVTTALTLGAGHVKAYLTLISEIRGLILLSIVAGFGRVIAEIGISMMLGGNIYGKTRTITTGIALLTSKGEFSKAMALGIVLLIIVFGINAIVYTVTHREK